MIVINHSNVELPAPPEKQLSSKDLQRMYRLQARSTLPFYDESRKLEPLGDEERDDLEALELIWNDRRPPRWGPIEFRFKPHGQMGCAYDLRPDVVAALMTLHPKRLKVIKEHELPPGVRTLRLKRYPTNQDMTPCSTEAEGREFAMVLREGGPNRVIVKESGFAGVSGGAVAPGESGGGGIELPGRGESVVESGSDLLEIGGEAETL